MTSPRRSLSLTQLQYFVVAAERGSMTAAAEELFIAQSAVSTSIAHLEQAVGVQLFIRQRARGLQLTAAGEELLGRARQILDSVDDAVASLNPQSIGGLVRVGCFRTLAPFFLPRIIRDLGESTPELRVDVSELTTDEVADALRTHAVDVALTYDLGLGLEVRREVLASFPLYAAVSRSHPLAGREDVSLAELCLEPMVLLDLPLSRDYFLRAFEEHGLRPQVRYRFGNYEAVRAMVAMGHGFTLLNQRPKGEYTYSGERLAHIRVREEVQPLDLVLAWADDGSIPARREQVFAEACRAVVQSG